MANIKRNIRKPGVAGNLNFCTFTKNCNGSIGWRFEIPAYAYCPPLAVSKRPPNMTENKAFTWIGLLNFIILICIWLFKLKDNLFILSLVVLIPNLIGILIINRLEKNKTDK